MVMPVAAAPAAEKKPANWIPLPTVPLFEKRKIRVITIGAGYSGLMMAYNIQHKFKLEDFVEHQIYEKNVSYPLPLTFSVINFGDSNLYLFAFRTMLVAHGKKTVTLAQRQFALVHNTVATHKLTPDSCDVPAHIYTFPWEPNAQYTKFYAGAEEIHEYIRRTTKKYNLDKNISYESKVIESIWDDDEGKWKLKIQKGDKVIEDACEVLLDASGILK